MARNQKSHSDGGQFHGERPWVYFMIDSFFLVTQFFVLTFHVRVDETVLPQKLPPGNVPISSTVIPIHEEKMTVHVKRATPESRPTYRVVTAGAGVERSAGEFIELLATAAQARAPGDLSVRVSYESDIPFGDVMPVFNACTKYKIASCGLIAAARQ